MAQVRLDDGQTLGYRREGRTGAPVLVLIPGSGADHTAWGAQLRGLAADLDLVAWDLPGTGESSWDGAPFSPGMVAARLLAALDQLGIRAFHLGGLSFGGAVAQELALAAPGRVRSLALFATWGATDRYLSLRMTTNLRLLREIPRELAAQALVARLISPELANQRFAYVEGLVRGMFLSDRATPSEVLAAHFEAGLQHEALNRLRTLNVPALVGHGSMDQTIPFQYGRQLAQALPRARFHLFEPPGAGHLIHVEASASFNDLLRQFIGEVEEGLPESSSLW